LAVLHSPATCRELSGRAVNQSLQYCPTEEDEVEDLFLLLKEVKVRLLWLFVMHFPWPLDLG